MGRFLFYLLLSVLCVPFNFLFPILIWILFLDIRESICSALSAATGRDRGGGGGGYSGGIDSGSDGSGSCGGGDGGGSCSGG